jgi:hypothetical protein
METSVHFDEAMIAPCGINCGTCIAWSPFLANEVRKWSCPNGDSNLSVHRDICLRCNLDLKREFLL